MANVARTDGVRAERFATEITKAFAFDGALVARTDVVGDAELRRATARKVARAHGRYVATGYYGPFDELVWARLYDHPVTDADRRGARTDVEYALFAAAGEVVTRALLPE